MSSSFLFLPRAVSKTKRSVRAEEDAATKPSPSVPETKIPKFQPEVSKTAIRGSGDGTHGLSSEEYRTLISLALSDYALWSDPDLRQLVATSASPSDGEPAFIPLRQLLRRSKVLAPLNLVPHESAIAKAIRSNSQQWIELRLLVSDPTSSRDLGMYEIRRKDWVSATTTAYTRNHWEERTIYAEHIPVQHKTIPNIARFVSSMLSSESSSGNVQGVILPPHHRDRPGGQPAYKGFALFILENADDVDNILKCWPWSPTRSSTDTEANTNVKDGLQSGFRTLTKARWSELKEEYQSFNRRIIDEINTWNDTRTATPGHSDTQPLPPPTREEPKSKPEPVPKPRPTFNQFSKFPPNSLVFVRNLHPETNKTTLRKLFSTPSSDRRDLQSDGIDYVDYNKGMDSCHLRFATPQHAQALVDHFTYHSLIQKTGLDEVGAPLTQSSSPSIAVELVTGRREELYWEKVPEKVRVQAVQKALQSIGDSTSEDNNNTRKRRKR